MTEHAKMKQHQQSIGKSDEWITPHWILDPLGRFDLDPCASDPRPWNTAATHYTEHGLDLPWTGRIWCNPPFNRFERPRWMARMAEHNNGIMLVPAACETKSWRESVWGRCAGVLMLSKRPHFCDTRGNPARANSGCTIALIAYGERNFEILTNSELGYPLREISCAGE